MDFFAVIIVVSALVVIVIVWLIALKCNCYLTQIIGNILANVYNTEKVNVKHTPSHGEDIEMFALIDERNVINNSEGQQNSFRRTYALAAWAQCQK